MTESNIITKTEGIFEGWAIIELMGHRKLGGYLSEQTIAGVAFVRIDVINIEGIAIATQFYSANAVYCITPTAQDVAIAFGANNKPEPVARWELPSAKITSVESSYSESSYYEEDDIFA